MGFDIVSVDGLPTGDAAARAIVVAISDAVASILGVAGNPMRTDPTGTTTQPVSGTVAVSNLPATQAVSAAALPLPAGAAADATLTARLGTLGQKLAAGSAPVVLASDQGAVPVSGSVSVSNLPGTQAVSIAATVAVSAVSLPLPAGAALDATLTGGTQKTQLFDGTSVLGTTAHPVKTDPTGTTIQPVSGTIAVSGTLPISAASLPLPAGAAQDATVTARLGTLGQKLSAGSAPVVLASDQSSVPVTVGNFPATQPVSVAATVAVSAAALPLPAGAAADATLTARFGLLGQKAMTASAPVTIASDQGAIPVSGTVAVSNLPATQPVSAAALPLPAGAAADATLTARLGTLGQKTMVGSAPVVLSSDQSSVPVTVGNFPATQPVSVAATVAVSAASLPLPTGAALDATLTARLGTLGQKLAAGSAPVVLASDQGAVPISGSVAVSNFPATQPVSAVSLPLPAGAALDATLTGGTQKTQIFDGTSVLGTTAHPVKTDPTGTTTQPISGTVAVSGTVPISIAAALPGGANALGSVSVSNLPGTQPVSGTVSATQGTAAAATAPWPTQLSDGAAAYVGTKTGQLPAALVGGRVDANNGAWLGSTAPTVGAKTGANSIPVVLASDQATLPVSNASLPLPTGASQDATLTGGTQKTQLYDGTNVIGTTAHPVAVTSTPIASATPAQSSVAGSATNVVLLASNTSRKGATIFNDSTATLYLKLGVTASLTSHTVQMLAGAYYELPFAYNGEVGGLWATAAGSARVTELT